MAFAKLRIYNNIKEVENEEEFESYWEISDGENNIKVRPINNEIKLYINDKLQDVISDEVKCATLNGKLTNGKEVKVAITIVNSHVNCYIFVDNEYRKENYRILDYLTDERIDSSNLDLFLSKCQEYLIEQFPILEIFKEKDIIKDEIVLNDKMTKYAKYLDDMVEIKKPTNEITIDKIKV